jgi:guanylate kinase
MNGRGNLFIIAAPSGGGKTSLVNAMLAADSRLALSVSHTTREPRSGEEDGKQYHFVSREKFRELVNDDAFLEHATVFGNDYGTHAGALENQLESGCDVILEIDWQGAAQVRKIFPDCCSIFILPPSLEILRHRLSHRAQDSEEVIRGRMRDAQAEISHWAEFNYLIVNEEFETALGDLQSIIQCTRQGRICQQEQHAQLLANLLGNG